MDHKKNIREHFDILISQKDIEERLESLVAEIENDHPHDGLVVVGVLKGSFIFMADLVRRFKRSVRCDFLRVSSYEGSHSSGQVRMDFDMTQPITGEHVLLIEDIVDTGRTLHFLLEHLKLKEPKSLKVCSLLYKDVNPDNRKIVDYIGFEIPHKFVLGYGLDYEGRYRELPYIGYTDQLPE